MNERNRVVAAQDSSHGTDHDYDKGSPHLRHRSLRDNVERRLTRLVRDSIERTGSCRVLEIGAGHGTFTSVLLEAGAHVHVTEASQASADRLVELFGDHPRVEVEYDANGDAALHRDEEWDLAVMISVVHHIPDYLAAFELLTQRIVAGGAIFTVQDPLYYPRRTRVSHVASRGTYFAWRLAQGNFTRGLRTRWRRLRGVYADDPSDLVEYHVVRQGVDEEAIAALLRREFDVEIFSYWSTQSPLFHRLLERTSLRSDFGIEATGHRVP